MKLLRTIAWLLLLAMLLVFTVANWGQPPVTVRIWENLVVETKMPAIVVISLLIGFVPMWLYHRASRWRMQRRMQSLEASARASAMPPPAEPAPPAPLDAESQPIAPVP
jgi:putative membrane protein